MIMKRGFFLERVGTQKEENTFSKLIPDLFSSLAHLCDVLAPNKAVEQDKTKKKHPSYMYDDLMHT